MHAQPQILHQRTRGTADVALQGGRIKRLFTQGSAKAITLPDPRRPEIVFLNTSGGLTGGDRLGYALQCDSDTTATTQTAERAYRAGGGIARMDVALDITRGRLDWLPQETILFDRSALRRRTRIALGPEAECLTLEAIVLGRAAMGETVQDLLLHDTREISRAGRPVLVEPLKLTAAALHGSATLAGARAFASMALVARGAEDALAPVRAALDEPGVQGAASGFDGKLTIRLMAADGWPLRRQIARLVQVLRPGPLPRVWQI
ncbi:urease accessory protein UreD [Pararhodobacter marinus]|uniref:urease accessory protein UreD n=1 Tax=Pararhodobacter marinus TaxID=2184063 RepID=UPI0035115EC2